MKNFLIIFFALFIFSNKTSFADQLLSSHTIGHITGGLGSIFLGPLPGLGLAILPEAIDIIQSERNIFNDKKVFYVNEYSKEFHIEPLVSGKENKITKYINSVNLTNSLNYQ